MTTMRLSEIRVGTRYRKRLGNIGALAVSIAQVGLLHPIVVTPAGVLIAGARRLAAYRALGWEDIPATVRDLKQIVRGEYAENAYREPLAPSDAVAIARAVGVLERKAAKERQREGGRKKAGANLAQAQKGKARDKVAAATGRGRTSLAKAEEVVAAAEAEPQKFGDLVEEMDRTGKVTGAHRKMRQRRDQERIKKLKPVPGRYRTLVIDPPWDYEWLSIAGRAAPGYATMSHEELLALPVEDWAEENAHLYLWVTNNFLTRGVELMARWGFQHKTVLTWVKPRRGLGSYFRNSTEHVLFGVRGKLATRADNIATHFEAPVGAHSEKPEAFYKIVRRASYMPCGEAFQRQPRKQVAKAYADWCFERRAQLPPAWMAVDTAATEAKAREALRERFEACFPFHPATLSVFQRKWQTLPQYQQTRGTLAMLALWLSRIYLKEHQAARREPLITLGSAPLEDRDFRAVVLGQLGEPRLGAAIEADLSAANSHAGALDADSRGPLRGIHRRVGAAILFESSGGQTEKVAHLPELRFALGDPEVDTTSIDTAAAKLEGASFFIRRAGTDGFRIGAKPKLTKVMADRRASLDEEAEVKPARRKLVQELFEKGAQVPVFMFPKDGGYVEDSAAIQDTPRLALIVADPALEWQESGAIRGQIAEWTLRRGAQNRLYPGSLIWCVRKQGRDLGERVEIWLAWRRVQQDLHEGLLGTEIEAEDRRDVQVKVRDAEEAARDAVWAEYRYAALADSRETAGLKVIDLGAGHSSAAESLSGRVISALRSNALLNESVGAGYIDRHWPPALTESGAWPLSGLRQSFLDGSLTRLLDPDRVLRSKILEFVERGDFGLASRAQSDGTYERLWHAEPVVPEEVSFEAGVFLLKKETAARLKAKPVGPEPKPEKDKSTVDGGGGKPEPTPEPEAGPTTIRVSGTVPPELWNRLGTKLIPKLRAGKGLALTVEFSATVEPGAVAATIEELRQVLADLGLDGALRVERGRS